MPGTTKSSYRGYYTKEGSFIREGNTIRRTTLFGTWPIDKNDHIVNDESLADPSRGRYIPDIVNDLGLSDHYPLIQDTTQGKVLSFNLMNLCRYIDKPTQGGSPFWNNGLDKQESFQEYEQRLGKLAELISDLKKQYDPSVVTFQEAPSFTNNHDKPGLGDYRQIFYEAINKNAGLEPVKPQQRQGLATLYDPKKVLPDRKNKVIRDRITGNTKIIPNADDVHLANETDSSQPDRIQQTHFISQKDDTHYYVANIHGRFNEADKVAQYTVNLIQNNPHSIAMGDFNIVYHQNALLKKSEEERESQQTALSKHKNFQGAHFVVQGTTNNSKDDVHTIDSILLSDKMATAHSARNKPVNANEPTAQYKRLVRRRDNEKKIHQSARNQMDKVSKQAKSQPHKPSSSNLHNVGSAFATRLPQITHYHKTYTVLPTKSTTSQGEPIFSLQFKSNRAAQGFSNAIADNLGIKQQGANQAKIAKNLDKSQPNIYSISINQTELDQIKRHAQPNNSTASKLPPRPATSKPPVTQTHCTMFSTPQNDLGNWKHTIGEFYAGFDVKQIPRQTTELYELSFTNKRQAELFSETIHNDLDISQVGSSSTRKNIRHSNMVKGKFSLSVSNQQLENIKAHFKYKSELLDRAQKTIHDSGYGHLMIQPIQPRDDKPQLYSLNFDKSDKAQAFSICSKRLIVTKLNDNTRAKYVRHNKDNSHSISVSEDQLEKIQKHMAKQNHHDKSCTIM